VERRETRRRRHGDGEGATALLVVDMLNPYDHPEAEELAEHVGASLPGIEGGKERQKKQKRKEKGERNEREKRRGRGGKETKREHKRQGT